ncbi:MAG TPA: hypothetical protein VLX92_10890 [Kofleriaceae bacterium]|nr:hypothetical protein [Kofleriaceae bacterium]
MRKGLVIALFVSACGHHGHGGGPDGGALDGLTALEVKPGDQTLIIDQGVAATSQYEVIGTFEDGHTADVTSYVQLALADESLGTFAGPELTTATDHGGVTQVIASAGSIEGTTGLTVMFKQTWTDPGSTGLTGDPSQLFGGPSDPTRDPDLVYPNDGTLVPPNLGRLEFHFHPGANNTVFELSLENAVTDIKVYLQCTLPLNGGCIYQPDPQLWAWLANTNRGGDPVKWAIRGTDATGTSVGASSTLALSFAIDDVNGGIYYWTTTTEAIMRYDFASTTQTSATKYAGTELEGTCIGCHALSHDGTKLVAEVNGQNDGRTALVDVATKAVMNQFGSTPKSMFESWNPDGSAYVGVYGDSGATNYNLMVFDGNTANMTATIDVNGTATNPTDHPDWSADGQRIAFVRVGIAGTMQRMWNGAIYQVQQVGGGGWGPPQLLVPSANLQNNYYPAYAPDGRLLVYDNSHCTSGSNTGVECEADTNPTATLMAIDSLAGGTPVPLANANKPGIADGANTALTNSFPKWNPFVFARNAGGGHLAWITFSSKRNYGLRTPPGTGTLLWMAAIDLDAPAGTDPSFVAFALPFQDLTTSNHIAQWTDTIVTIQ